jgi:choline dehydrogenase-like flavoprotein
MAPPDFRFSDRQRAALTAIVNTFAPGQDGLPSASEHGVVDVIEEAVASNPRPAERRQVAQLLGLWDTALLTAVGGGGFRRFSDLPQARREDVLRSWRDSRAAQRRGAYQALRKAALLMYYMKPGPDGRTSPIWDWIGFPGPPGRTEEAAAPALTPVVADREMNLECDVVVVGSGAGGGPAAAVLSAAGLDVIVLEAGDYVPESELDGSEFQGYGSLYLNGGAMSSQDGGTGLLAGATLGGGTTINYTTAYRTPDEIREEWAQAGAAGVDGTEYARAMDAVFARLGVNDEHSWVSDRDSILQQGAVELGWSSVRVQRNAHGCPRGGEACANCGFGCPYGAKQSTARTWLADAAGRGAQVVVRARAQRVRIEDGRARGVDAVTWEGHRITIRSRAVVAACGALHTPALLRRSGLKNPNIGKHLCIQPAGVVFGVLDREVRPWEGVMQSIHVDEFTDLDGKGYGVRLQTAPLHPGFFVSFAPWDGAARHADLVGGLSHTAAVGMTVRDRDGGEVKVGRDGEPVVHYKLAARDGAHLQRGFEAAAEMLETVGAQRIYSSHAAFIGYEPGRSGDRHRFIREIADAGWAQGRAQLTGFHLLGSSRIGTTPSTSACGPEGETWDVEDLVVCDGSAFPSASGVNPNMSIQALSHLNASRLAERLGSGGDAGNAAG